MHPKTLTLLVLSALLPVACSPLSQEERNQLAECQQNAATYWGGGMLDQCLGMAEKGLEIDAEDYKLSTLKGMVWLRQASDDRYTEEQQQRLLQKAQEQLATVYDWRSPTRHEGFLLLGYGMVLQARGIRRMQDAIRDRDAARSLGERAAGHAERLEQAAAAETQGRELLAEARGVFEVLIERGDLTMLAHYHLMQVAAGLEQPDLVLSHGDEYLGAVRRFQEVNQSRIEASPTATFERELRKEQDRIRSQELDVRVFLAKTLYDRAKALPQDKQAEAYQAAVVHLDAVLAANPSRTTDYFNRGRCLRELGRNDQARDDFRRFVATSNLPASNPRMVEAVQFLGQ